MNNRTIQLVSEIVARRTKVIAQQTIRTIPYRTSRGMVFKGKVASGELYRSVQTAIEIQGINKAIITLSVASHIENIEEGRPPHPNDDSKLVPMEGAKGKRFRQWNFIKRGDEKAGYATRRSIQKYGIAPLALTDTIRADLIRDLSKLSEINRMALESYKVYIIQEITKMF